VVYTFHHINPGFMRDAGILQGRQIRGALKIVRMDTEVLRAYRKSRHE
jgi:hypothetical protein